MRSVKLLMGLGNSGVIYRGTRHNVGFTLLDLLAQRHQLTFKCERLWEIVTLEQGELSLLLIKPRTYMNLSGRVLAPLQLKYRFQPERDLLVITDNVDLPVGRCRLKTGSSGSTHNGLRSISGALGSQAYMRLLIGVGSVPERWELSAWVLSAFSVEDIQALTPIYSFLVEVLSAPFESFSALQGSVNSFRAR